MPRQNNVGVIAQSVEQRTENPCVPGSIPGDTTVNQRVTKVTLFFYAQIWLKCRVKQGNVFSNVLTEMTTVDVICYKYKPLKNGELPLKIKVCKDSTLVFLPKQSIGTLKRTSLNPYVLIKKCLKNS